MGSLGKGTKGVGAAAVLGGSLSKAVAADATAGLGAVGPVDLPAISAMGLGVIVGALVIIGAVVLLLRKK